MSTSLAENRTKAKHDKRKRKEENEERRLVLAGKNQPEKALEIANSPPKKKRKPKTGSSASLDPLTAPFGLTRLNFQLQKSQKEEIRKTGFGGMLHCNFGVLVDLEFCEFLLNSYRPADCVLDLEDAEKRVEITEEDVARVFDLPRGDLQIIEVDRRKQKEEDPELERLLQELTQDTKWAKGEI